MIVVAAVLQVHAMIGAPAALVVGVYENVLPAPSCARSVPPSLQPPAPSQSRHSHQTFSRSAAQPLPAQTRAALDQYVHENCPLTYCPVIVPNTVEVPTENCACAAKKSPIKKSA